MEHNSFESDLEAAAYTPDIDHAAVRREAAHAARLYIKAERNGTDKNLALHPHMHRIARTGLPRSIVQNIPRWFEYAFIRDERQQTDMAAHLSQSIGHTGMQIISDAVFKSRQLQLANQRRHLNQQDLVGLDESGGEIRIPASQVWNTPERRAAKHYIRTLGLEQFCISQGLSGFFLTLTLPGEYHPNPKHTNSRWTGLTPKQGHDEMQRRWRAFQKRFGKCMGVRVEEPHLDGCIHWHALVWTSRERVTELEKWLKHCFGEHPIATKIVAIDHTKPTELGKKPSKGASYLMKYVIDVTGSHFNSTSEDKASGQSNADRADAHRATWGGRAITFFDLPGSSTVWDEIRRIKPGSVQEQQLPDLGKKLHEAATGNQYCHFLELLQTANSKQRRCRVLYEKNDKGSRVIKGLRIDGIEIRTHEKKWVLQRRKV